MSIRGFVVTFAALAAAAAAGDVGRPRTATAAGAVDAARPLLRVVSAGLIAFERQSPDGGADVYVVRPNGGGLTRLTQGGRSHEPSWSPDGYRIAFVSDRDRLEGARELYLMNGDGSAQLRRTASLGQPFWFASLGDPAWTSNGRHIAFTRREVKEDESISDLWRVAAAAGSPVPLTQTPAAETSPSYAPDGALVYEVAGRIWLRSRTGRRRLVATGTEPQLSPDGGHVAFVRDGRLAIIPREGGQVRLLGAGRAPAWSPDGRRIVFAGPGGLSVTPIGRYAPRGVTHPGAGTRDVAPSWRGALVRRLGTA